MACSACSVPKVVWKIAYLGLAMVNELLVSVVGVDLTLVGCRLDASIAQQVVYLLAAEIGHTNGLTKTIVNKLLHRLPGVLHKRWKLSL